MACLGLDTSELEPVSYSSVKEYYQKRERSQSVPEQLVQLRWKTLNEWRYQKKNMIIQER